MGAVLKMETRLRYAPLPVSPHSTGGVLWWRLVKTSNLNITAIFRFLDYADHKHAHEYK